MNSFRTSKLKRQFSPNLPQQKPSQTTSFSIKTHRIFHKPVRSFTHFNMSQHQRSPSGIKQLGSMPNKKVKNLDEPLWKGFLYCSIPEIRFVGVHEEVWEWFKNRNVLSALQLHYLVFVLANWPASKWEHLQQIKTTTAVHHRQHVAPGPRPEGFNLFDECIRWCCSWSLSPHVTQLSWFF